MKWPFTPSISKQDMANRKNALLRCSIEKVIIIFCQHILKCELYYLNRILPLRIDVTYLTPCSYQFDDVQCFSIFIANTNKHTCTCCKTSYVK